MKMLAAFAAIGTLIAAPFAGQAVSLIDLDPDSALRVEVPTKASPDRLRFTITDTVSTRYWGSIVGGIFYTGGPVNFTNLTITKNDPWRSTYLLLGMINPL